MKRGHRVVAGATIVTISVLSHCAAVGAILVRLGTTASINGWNVEILFIICGSLGLSMVLIVLRRNITIVALLVVRVFIFDILSAPSADDPVVVGCVLLPLFADINYYLHPPRNLQFSAVALIVMVVFYLFYRTIGVDFSPELSERSLSLLGLGVGSGVVSYAIRYLVDQADDASSRISSLTSTVTQLQSTNSQFLGYASSMERRSVMSERKRITRDLHDVVGRTFTNIIAMMDAEIRRPADKPEDLVSLHKWVREHSQQGLKETRSVLYELRALKDEEFSGVPAVKSLIDTFKHSTGVSVNVDWANAVWHYPPTMNAAIYHIVQESLVNSLQHGKARQVNVHFWQDNGTFHVTVRDNGQGAFREKKGIGQNGMEERVAALGGMMKFSSVVDGYKVYAEIPVPLESRNE